MKENNNNTIYKYSQLYDILLEKILANEWKANDKMPTERELSIRYNVSRVTVRDTLNRLAQAGYIYRIQGKGTFVSVRKIEKKLTKLYTLRKRFEEKGVVHEVKTLQFEVISPSDDIREKLEIIEKIIRIIIILKLKINFTYLKYLFKLINLNSFLDIFNVFLKKYITIIGI